MYKNGNSKIIANLLNEYDNESSKFGTRKWYIISHQNNEEYGQGDENDLTINFETKVIKLFYCDYSDAHVLVTGDTKCCIADTNVAFKNCATYTRCVIHINGEHIDNTENSVIIMPMYNFIEYSDSYADSSGILYQFKRDESSVNNAGNPINIAMNN